MRTSAGPSQSRSFAWLMAFITLGGMVWLISQSRRNPSPPPAAPEPEQIDASRLIRLDGRLVRRENTNQSFTGSMTEQYPDGTLKSRSAISNGVLSGVSEGFYTNGILQIRELFVAGIGEGLIQKWHPDGSLLSEGTARSGQLDGIFRRWHTNGTLAEEIHLRNGQPHGGSRAWFASGSPKAEVELEDGKVVRQTFWKDGEKAPAAVPVTPQHASP